MNNGNSTAALPKDLEQRILRFNELIPCTTAFIDARTPGSDAKENFCLIGAGVAENPGQVVHIDIPHGFNIGAARQPNGCKNSHHSHDTEEVFFVHKGQWQFTWGEHGEDGQIILNEGETISLPTHLFRGFENVGNDDGFLFGILGIDKEKGVPGHVTWAPYVHENANDHGLVLLKDGRLLDTKAGDQVPDEAEIEQPPSLDDISNFKTMTVDDMLNCIQRNEELGLAAMGGISVAGVKELAVIGEANELEAIGAGKMAWGHGFQVRRLQFQAGAVVPLHKRNEEEVLFVYRGSLEVIVNEFSILLEQGDLITTPIGAERCFYNPTKALVDLVVVRGGNAPTSAQFI